MDRRWAAPSYVYFPQSQAANAIQKAILTFGTIIPSSAAVVNQSLRQHRYGGGLLINQTINSECPPLTDSMKTTMNMHVLKCHTVDGVLRELHAFALIYNLIREVMQQAADRQGVPVARISFIDALRWLKSANRGDQLNNLVVLPHRPDRYEPRVKKRRAKTYRLMRKPRRELKQILAQQ